MFLPKCYLVAVIVYVAGASRESSRAAYEEFRSKYGRKFEGTGGAVSYAERHARFVKYKTAVEQHNRQPGRSWDAEVNEFADFTDEEIRSRLGYVASSWRNSQLTASSSFLETRPVRTLADSVDWRTNSKVKRSSSFLRNQGGCGSCWAVAAAGALEMHAEANSGTTDELSFEQLVDCTPNLKHCGGTGGCKGATAELAFQYAKDHGLGLADGYKGYVTNGKEGTCKHAKEGERRVKIDDFVTLPINKLRPLMEAVQDKGPVVVSVAAEGWSMYGKGVFNGCSRNATVNHAVLLVGYGKDTGKKGKPYWLIRNSWGGGWGEDGHIRLERHASDEGDDGYCGTDKDPQQGVGCDGGPATLPVCGMCGVLSDSAYPKGVQMVGKQES